MIAVALAANAATYAAPFTPPLDRAFAYRTVDTRPLPGGEARITLDQTLRFDRVAGELRATTLGTGQAIDAPDPYRGFFTLLFATFNGVATTVRLTDDGAITGVEHADTTWAAVREAERAMLARIEADPTWSPTSKAGIRAMAASAFDVAPDAQVARLTDSVATLLAPSLPPLRDGERRAFTTTSTTPAGSLASMGAITLARADAAALTYQIETRTAPAATAPAVAALLATIGATTDAARRRQIEATAASIRDASYVERTELVVERSTGLLLHVRTERLAEMPDAAVKPLQTTELTRGP